MANSKRKFEDKLEELEKIIATLENGDVALDESIKKYTEAMKLVKECDDELKDFADLEVKWCKSFTFFFVFFAKVGILIIGG